MVKKLVGANWKSHYNKEFLKKLKTSTEITQEVNDKVEIFLAVPYIYLENIKEKIPNWISIGAQDCSQYCKGSHTGEITAQMLKDIGCKYVILGHSERRHGSYFESSEIIAKKVINVLNVGMCPVLCVGETKDERDQEIHFDVVEDQMLASLADIKDAFKVSRLHKKNEDKEDGKRLVETLNIVIAYEPVWAIGTGLSAENYDIFQMMAFIKKVSEDIGIGPRIIYGGSVNKDNIAGLCTVKYCDGFLVGKASMDEQFFEIIREVSNSKQVVSYKNK